MKHHRIYQAGPMTGLTVERAIYGWRAEFAARLKDIWEPHTKLSAPVKQFHHRYDLYSPMRGHEYLPAETVLDGEYTTDALTSQGGMFYRDRNDVKNADVIVACFLEEEGISAGTCMEMGWADAFQVPVVMVARPDSPHRTHPLLAHAATYIVDDLADAARVVRSILLP